MWRVLARLGIPGNLIIIISSFHSDMTASIRVRGDLLVLIRVENGLRLGFTMAPVLFNLNTCVVFERWRGMIADDGELGIPLIQFRRERLFNTKLAEHRRIRLTECEFADDSTLLAVMHAGAGKALSSFRDVVCAFGLSVNLSKTKYMAWRLGLVLWMPTIPLWMVLLKTLMPFTISVAMFCQTPGARLMCLGELLLHRVRSVRCGSRFSTVINSASPLRIVCGVTVLAVLLYGSESWTVEQRDVRRLESFHLQCVCSILKVNHGRQIEEHISFLKVRKMWGDVEEVADKVRVRRLRWLGHVSRMQDRIPRQLLYGALRSKRPPHGPCKLWKDSAKCDLMAVGVPLEQLGDIMPASSVRGYTYA